jgi:hypothetical protein
MAKMKRLAFGCVTILVVALIAVFIFGPYIQTAAHRRTFGRGAQTVVELLFPFNDLFEDLAAVKGDISVGKVVLDEVIVLRYAGPYAIDLRTTKRPQNPLPDSVTPPEIVISMTFAGVDPILSEIRELNSPFWGKTHGFMVYRFDAPGELPLDQPIGIRVVIEKAPDGFIELYGPDVEVAVGRQSSE